MSEQEAQLQPTQETIIGQIEEAQAQVHAAFRYVTHTAELINRGKGGREVALAITKLQEAKAWLHEALIEAN